MSRLRPIVLRCSPDPATYYARLDIEIEGGHTLQIVLDPAFARSLSACLDDIGSGAIALRAPSRRALEIALSSEDEFADTQRPKAAGEGR